MTYLNNVRNYIHAVIMFPSTKSTLCTMMEEWKIPYNNYERAHTKEIEKLYKGKLKSIK